MPGKQIVHGYVEKKKDWLLRARDYQKKESKLRELRQKAEFKNRDEFNYHMLRSQVGLNGVHYDLESSDEETETQKLFSDIQDLQYVTNRLSMERKKIEKLKSQLHFTNAPKSSKIIFVDSDDEEKGVISKAINSKESQSTNPSKKMNVDLIEAEQERQKKYDELAERIEREKELKIVAQKLQLKKELVKSKNRNLIKPKLIKKGGPTKPAVYKWTYERKK